jgi:hypothetical protein
VEEGGREKDRERARDQEIVKSRKNKERQKWKQGGKMAG